MGEVEQRLRAVRTAQAGMHERMRELERRLSELERRLSEPEPLIEPAVFAELQPEPPPVPGQMEVLPNLLEHERGTPGGLPELMERLLLARQAQGRARYGRPLETGNGRNALHDALQEAIDGWLYDWQNHMERTGTPEGLHAQQRCRRMWRPLVSHLMRSIHREHMSEPKDGQ